MYTALRVASHVDYRLVFLLTDKRYRKWQVRELLVEMIVGGVSLDVVDELRSVAAASFMTDSSLHSLLTDAVTSAVNTLRSVCYSVDRGR